VSDFDPAGLIAWMREQTGIDKDAADRIHHVECNSIPGTWDDGGPCDCPWPAKVLAEVEAKRRIIDAYEAILDQIEIEDGPDGDPVHSQSYHDEMTGLQTAVQLLATVYADRDGYQAEEWKPWEPEL
jgi:hypothetical protein